MRVLIGRRLENRVPVTAAVTTYLGLSAYASLPYLSRLAGERYCANTLLADLAAVQPPRRFYRAVMDRPVITGPSERTRSFRQLDETFGETMGTMISIMVFLAGMIAFGSVLNTALVSLSERQRDVGTLRVLGYSPRDVWLVFSGETFLLNVLGITGGLAAGIGLAHLLSLAYSTELYRFPVVVYPSRLLVSALLMVFFVGIAQLIVLRLVARFQWLQVLGVKE
jgi:putative ABC transport system permease protein